MSEVRIAAIRDALQTQLNPSLIEIKDESHLHVGHAGAKDGRGHFSLRIQAAGLAGKTRIQQHKMIYQTLGTLMSTDIHALSIEIL